MRQVLEGTGGGINGVGEGAGQGAPSDAIAAAPPHPHGTGRGLVHRLPLLLFIAVASATFFLAMVFITRSFAHSNMPLKLMVVAVVGDAIVFLVWLTNAVAEGFDNVLPVGNWLFSQRVTQGPTERPAGEGPPRRETISGRPWRATPGDSRSAPAPTA